MLLFILLASYHEFTLIEQMRMCTEENITLSALPDGGLKEKSQYSC